MIDTTQRRLLFVINHFSGRKSEDWETVIRGHFKDSPAGMKIYRLPEKFDKAMVMSEINDFTPDTVVAVGGDGTVNLLADCIRNTKMSLGIVPAGSANGMARELGIRDAPMALKAIEQGVIKRISLLEINGRISVHLSDIGINAYMVREFDLQETRGLIGYLFASAKVLKERKQMHVDITFNGQVKSVRADIILIANATTYGTGVVVNPVGKLDDNVFEVIAISDLTLRDLLNTSLHTLRVDERKTTIFQVSAAKLHCTRPVHFQVDGEYLGKVQDIEAKILPASLNIIVIES